MPVLEETYDVCVVGAGHAGCEAALACARLGLETILFTVSIDSVALMPCNPNIGGSSKGHLVREVDALGGQMGVNIDKTFLQSKMLNKSKGPAVHSLRAQADKQEYSNEMRKTLQSTEHLTLRQAEVAEILTEWDLNKGNDASGKEKDISNEESAVSNNESVIINSTLKNSIGKESIVNSESNIKSTDKRENTDCINKQVERGETQKIVGCKTVSGAIYHCKAVILCTGTYLNARCLVGEMITYTGPNGLQAANHLTDSLVAHGIQMRRFKTGTPARIDGRSLDYSKMTEQFGDERVVPFSFTTNPEDVQIDQVSCWLTYTTPETHEIIRTNLDRSPIYAGIIEGTGPRYCPSIEDKVVKFPDKDRHQLFIEPEGRYTNEMYVSGMSSSMPEDVQHAMYRTMPGFEHAKIVKNAYAIEYDCIDANQLYPSLEFRQITGLFSGGQFNGTSGYEEAAGQGLIAGINAAMKILGREPLILDRSESYIGVLIDDLVTKQCTEPYRMMTSRAEYRLLLRQDNADLRLTKKGYEVGLISQERYDWVCKKEQMIDAEVARVKHVRIGATPEVQLLLEQYGSIPLSNGLHLDELIRRPELDYDKLAPIDADRPSLPEEVREQVNILIKYEGYIARQNRQVQQFKKLEKRRLPDHFDYKQISGLRLEATQKLNQFQPVSIGQASRIAGVTPADVSVLLVYLEQLKYANPELFQKLNREEK